METLSGSYGRSLDTTTNLAHYIGYNTVPLQECNKLKGIDANHLKVEIFFVVIFMIPF